MSIFKVSRVLSCVLPHRNPLQSVLGSISFLREQFDESSECYEDIAAITVAATDMARVVSDISDWVKVSEGQLRLELKPEKVLLLLDTVVSLASRKVL